MWFDQGSSSTVLQLPLLCYPYIRVDFVFRLTLFIRAKEDSHLRLYFCTLSRKRQNLYNQPANKSQGFQTDWTNLDLKPRE